jgi:hypothetical protein
VIVSEPRGPHSRTSEADTDDRLALGEVGGLHPLNEVPPASPHPLEAIARLLVNVEKERERFVREFLR